MTITFPVYQLASFDEEKAAWILEGGTYGIWWAAPFRMQSLQEVCV